MRPSIFLLITTSGIGFTEVSFGEEGSAGLLGGKFPFDDEGTNLFGSMVSKSLAPVSGFANSGPYNTWKETGKP